MLKWLSKKLGQVQSRTLLGQAARLRASQLIEGTPGLSLEEAEQIASGEAVASLRAGGVDATSPVEVAAWSERFLAGKDMPPRGDPADDRGDLPKGCDFVMTAAEIRDSLKMMEQEGAAKGEAAYYKPEFLEVLYPFVERPSATTAIPLLEVAPFLRSYFEKCSPGGEFYEIRRLLNGR